MVWYPRIIHKSNFHIKFYKDLSFARLITSTSLISFEYIEEKSMLKVSDFFIN